MRVAKELNLEFRILMSLEIFCLLQTPHLVMPIRPLVRFVDSQRGFLPSPVIQFLATSAALLTRGLAHRRVRCLAAASGSLIGQTVQLLLQPRTRVRCLTESSESLSES